MRKIALGLLLLTGLIVAIVAIDNVRDTVGTQDGNSAAGSVEILATDTDGQGDQPPEEEDAELPLVTVSVAAPDDAGLSGTIIVALEDYSLADVAAVELVTVSMSAAELMERDDPTIDVVVPVPLDGSLLIGATVHVDSDDSGTVSPGDWISPDLVPVSADNTAVTVTVVPT